MSDRILPFRSSRSGGQGGSGPHDPGYEARIARLEQANERIEATLGRIEATVAQTAASTHRLEVELAEMRGRIKGIEDRFSSMPTSLQLISVVVALVVAAGLFRFFAPRFPGPQTTQQQTRQP